MFEGLAESLLKSILGEYVENWDAQQLSISVWSGHVSLRDLRLKSDLCAKLNLPFDLKLGIIKHLVLEVPWARLTSAPVVCKLDQLFLILSPQKERDWKMQDVTAFAAKEGKLREYLQRHLAQATVALAQQMAQEAERLAASGTKANKQSQKQAQQQAGYFERYITRIKDNLQVGISNIHVRLEDQQEKVVAEDKCDQESNRAQQSSGLREPSQPNGRQSIITDKVCIGLTLKELTLRTNDFTANAAAEGAGEGNEEFESMDSSSDSEEQEGEPISGVGKSQHDLPRKSTSASGISAQTEGKAGLTVKKVASPVAGSFFFDRTVKENRGVPLLREFSIKGFAIYIDSGPETRLISFPSSRSTKSLAICDPGEGGSIEASSHAPLPGKEATASKRDPALTPEELDKAMQEIHKRIFEAALDPRPGLSPEEAGALGQGSRAGGGTSDSEERAAFASFIIKPQSVYGRMVQQTLDLELPSAQPDSGYQGRSKKPKQKPAKKATVSMGAEASSQMAPDMHAKSSPTTSTPQLALDVQIQHLTVQLQKSQYECIFRMAEYVRRYNLKHENFNRHRKYKFMRPIFPLNFDLGKIRSEIEVYAEINGGQARSEADVDGFAIINGAKRRQEVELMVPDDYGLITLETQNAEEQRDVRGAITYESPMVGRIIAARNFIERPVTLEEIGHERVLERLVNKVRGNYGATEWPQTDSDVQTEMKEQAHDANVTGLRRASINSMVSQEFADDELLFQDALDDSEKPGEVTSTGSTNLTPGFSAAKGSTPAIVDRSYIMLYQIDCTKRKNRQLLHKIPAENINAKAWWQYAIGCVIKDNRQTRTGNWNEFHVEAVTKKRQYQALQLLLGKLVDESEPNDDSNQKATAPQDKNTKKGRGGSGVPTQRDNKEGPRQKNRGPQARSKVQQPTTSFQMDLELLDDSEMCILVHCVEAVQLKELRKWIKSIVHDKVATDEHMRQEELRREQQAMASKEEAKTSNSETRKLGSVVEKLAGVQPTVKQGYGSQILGYITFWGGSPNQSAQNAAEQQKAAEAAVEAVTLAEASKEPGLVDEEEDTETVESQITEDQVSQATEEGGDHEKSETLADEEVAMPTRVDKGRASASMDFLNAPAPAGENTFRFQLRCRLGQASIVVENICPRQSLILYFKSIQAEFQTRNQGQRLRMRNGECGINHVTLSENRFEQPAIKPLIEVKGLQAPEEAGISQKKSHNHAWRFDLAIRSTSKEEPEPTAATSADHNEESQTHSSMQPPLAQKDGIGNQDSTHGDFEPHVGSGSSDDRVRYESKFDTKQIKVFYQAEVVQNLYKFFQLDQADELRAQALDRIAQLSEQSQMSLREMIQQQRVSKIDFNLGKITVVIPFRAHNSDYVGEAETLRDRAWHLSVAGTNLQSVENTASDDIYEKFKLTLRAFGLKFGKRDYPNLLEVIEELDLALLIRLKSKLKSLLQKDQQGKSKVDGHDSDGREDPQREQEPEVVVSSLDGKSLPDLRLNFTPDAYNSFLNLYGVLAPENTKAEITRQFKEKQNIIQASSFNKVMLTLGVRETRLTNSWHSYFVVLSGSYIYFYKEEQDLMPYHYLYVMSTSAHRQNQQPGSLRQPGEVPGNGDTKFKERNMADGNQSLPEEQLKDNQSFDGQRKQSSDATRSVVDTILVLRGRNGEQISLNFGRMRVRRHEGQPDEGSSKKRTQSRQNTAHDADLEAVVDESAGSKRSGASVGSCSRSRHGSKHSTGCQRRKDHHHRGQELQDAESTRAFFQSLINRKQQEFRGNTDLVDDSLSTKKEAVSSRITHGNLSPEQYYKQSSLKLGLLSQHVHIRLFKDDFTIMNDKNPNYDRPGGVWAFVTASNISLDLTTQPFDNHIQLEIGQACIKEASRLHRDILVLDEPTRLSVTIWSINSPTIKDSEIEVQASLSGRPIFVFDPIFVNQLIKYFRNTANQAAENVHNILKELLEQQKHEKARQQARIRQEQALGQGRLFGLHAGQEADELGGQMNVSDLYKTPQFLGEGQRDEVILDDRLCSARKRQANEGRDSSSDHDQHDQANFDQGSQDLQNDSARDEAGSSSEGSEEKESCSQTCQSVKLIMIKTELKAPGGLTLICLHHKFTTAPYMELRVENLSLKHHMMYDHDVLEAEFGSAVLNDLTMWPKTQDPRTFRDKAEATQKRVQAGEHFLETQSPSAAGHAQRSKPQTLAEYVKSLPRQEMLGIKDSTQPSGITMRTTIIYDGCPLKNDDWGLQCIAKLSNMRLHVFQEQLMRVISYFTNRLLWALTSGDPYEEFNPPAPKREMSVKEINHIKDLEQPDFGMDLQVEVVKSSVLVQERPYLDHRALELEIECIKISMQEEAVTGRHANLPKLSMKLSRMNFDIQSASMLFIDQDKGTNQRQPVSNTFNIDFALVYPNYSAILEQISSKLLDKSSEMILKLHPTMRLNLSQELYTFMMRCNSLNFSYFDNFGKEFDFSQVNEIFQSKDNLLYMRTKIEIEKEFLLILEQEGQELVEMKLRNAEQSSRAGHPDGRQLSTNRELLRVDQFLDGQLRIQVQMAIPTLLHPSEPESESGPLAFEPGVQLYQQAVKHLLLGTKSDPHIVYTESQEVNDVEKLDAESKEATSAEPDGHEEAPKHGKPGKFLFKMHWAPDGEQQMDCKIDKVKVFIRPNCFMKIGHFFGYGYPEFDLMSEDRPNAYETDVEKLPIMKLKIDILDSMICMDSFEPADLVGYLESQALLELQDQILAESSLAGGLGSAASSTYARQPQSESWRGTTPRGYAAMSSAAGASAMADDPLKSNKEAQDSPGSSNFTTIVCSAQRIEYVYGREQLSCIKEDLYQKLKEFARARQKKKQKQEAAEAEEAARKQEMIMLIKCEDQIDSSSKRVPGPHGSPDLAAPMQFADPSESDKKNTKEQEQTQEVTEVSCRSYMRMLLKVRQFSPYICDSIDLDNFGFDEIQKRQLISPMDVTFSHGKLLRIEHFDSGKPARFTPFQKNEIEVGKALLKVTFSDVLVLQETSNKLLESQQRYEDFLIEYLSKYKKTEIIQEQRNQRTAEKKERRTSSFLSFGHTSRTGRGRESFQSCPRAESGDYDSAEGADEEELIKNEANQVTSHMRNNLVTYMTGFSSQKAAGYQYQSHGSVSLRSRQNSGSEFFDARSRSSISGQSQSSHQSRISKRSPAFGRQSSAAAFYAGRHGQSQNFTDHLGAQRANSRLESGSGLIAGAYDRKRSRFGSSAVAMSLAPAATGAQHLQERQVAVIQEEEQINETDREGEEDLFGPSSAMGTARRQGTQANELMAMPKEATLDIEVVDDSHVDRTPSQLSDHDNDHGRFYSIRGVSQAESRAGQQLHHITELSQQFNESTDMSKGRQSPMSQRSGERMQTIIEFEDSSFRNEEAVDRLIPGGIDAVKDQMMQANSVDQPTHQVRKSNEILPKSDSAPGKQRRYQQNDKTTEHEASRLDRHDNDYKHVENVAAASEAQRAYAVEDTDSDEDDLIIWDVAYGDEESYSGMQFRTAVHLSGIHMMIINDHKNVFYPILQMNMEKCSLTLENRLEGLSGDTDIKMMISYYNNGLDVWEPFLESTHLRLSIEQDVHQSQLYAGFQTPVNLNISEELIENVLHAFMSLEKTKKEEASSQQHQNIVNQHRRQTLKSQMGAQALHPSEYMAKARPTQRLPHRGTARGPAGGPLPMSRPSEALGVTQSQRLLTRSGGNQPLQSLTLGQAKRKPQEIVRMSERVRKNLEFKVTPYRIVNMTSKKLMVRRNNISSVLTSRHTKAPVDSQGQVAASSGSHSSGRYGHQSRQAPQGSSSKGKSSRFQNQLTKHPILQQQHQRLENAKGETSATGNHGALQRQGARRRHPSFAASSAWRSQVPSKYHIDSGGSVDYEVDYEEEAKQLIMTSKDDLVRKQDFIDIIFDEGKSEKDKIRAYNLANQDLHQHPFSSEQFDFIIFGMSMSKSKVRKTFTLRSPFIIFNKTESTYMLKIIKYQSSEEKIMQIAPGEGYPLSHQELRCKIMFSTYQDYYDAQDNPQLFSQKQDEIWSSHFKVSNFFLKHDISKKKFFVYHAQKFSMIFVQPGQFFPAWDICIKVPLVIRNTLPFNLRIRTHHVRKYIQPRSMLLSSQKKKEIISEKMPTEYVIPKQGKQFFHNFNLEGEVRFEMNLGINNDQSSEPDDPLMSWYQFVLVRDEYKSNDKTITLVDRTSGQTLELCAKIKSTEQTDLEITFYCQNCIVNNTDQNIVLWSQEGKKRLACQNAEENSVIMLSDKTTKVLASIQEGLAGLSHPSSKNMSQAFPVNVVGITNRISIMKDRDRHHEFILNTTWSMVSPTETIYSKITTINPQYVVCNETNRLLLIAQSGFQDRQVEVIPHQGRLPLYWTDAKAQQRLQFKLAEAGQQAFDDTPYEWSKKIKPQKIGRISIRCRNKRNVEESEHVVVIKQVNKETQTVYLIFQIENEASPTYRIENLTKSIWMEYFQQGIVPSADCYRETLAPGKSAIYSWTDPERTKTKKILCCHLDLLNRREGKLRTMQKVEIELDNLEYQQTFRGKFVDDDFRDLSASDGKGRRQAHQLIKKALQAPGTPNSEEDAEVRQKNNERIIKIETTTDGCTKTLRLTERSADERQLTQAEDPFQIGHHDQKGKEQLAQKSKQAVKIKAKSSEKQGKLESKLESIDDPNVFYEVQEKPARESKMQLDIGMMYISFIARNDKRIRREFLLGYLEGIEFLVVDAEDNKDMQLRLGYLQLDNNINSEGRQLFPYVLYPKEVQNRYNNLLDQPKSQAKRRQRKDFFNAHVRMKQSQSDLVYVHKMEFLLQSAVLQMDDELIGWIIRFAECFAAGLGANLTDVHQVFDREESRIHQARQEPPSSSTTVRFPEDSDSKDKQISAQNTPTKWGTSDSASAFGASGHIGSRSLLKASEGAAFRRPPERRQGTWFHFSTPSGDGAYVPRFAQMSPDSWRNYDIDVRSNPVFIQELLMSPIDIEITFRTRVKSENEIIVDDTSPVMRGLKQLGLSLTNVDKAAFRLNSLVIAKVYGTPEEISTVLYAHYRHRLMKNVLGLFLSSAALGNMNLLAQDIGTGVKDFFYRPAEGFVDGPIEGGKGLVIGTVSLLGNTAKGAFGSVSRIVNTISKSLLFLAGDEDFIDQREQNALDKPDNVLQGLAYGLKSTFTGVASGVTGIYQQPVKGARAGGVKGFVKGAVKGLGGAVVKPLSGGLDLLMKTSEGAHSTVSHLRLGGRGKQTAAKKAAKDPLGQDQPAEEDALVNQPEQAQEVGNKKSAPAKGSKQHDDEAQAMSKIRTFRPFYGRDQRLKQFNEFQAFVALNLKHICKADYANDHFLDAIIYVGDQLQLCIILTEERLLIVDAIDKSKIKDLPTDRLCMVEGRPVQPSREQRREEEKQGTAHASSRTTHSYDLVIRVFEEVLPFEVAHYHQDRDQIDSSARLATSGPSSGEIAALQARSSGDHRVMVESATGPRAVVDGYSLRFTSKSKLKDIIGRLENYIWYVKSQSQQVLEQY